MRRGLAAIAIMFAALGVGTADAENTRILVGGEYFETAQRLIGEAKESITAAIYIINVEPAPDTNPASILLEGLINVKKRGVKVKVVLDKSMLEANYNAYKRLEQAGIEVSFNTRRAVLHGKGIVIDSKICIIGSYNWTRASLQDNYEFAALIDDAQEAAKILDYISTIELTPAAQIQPDEAPGVRLAVSLLTATDKPALSKLVVGRASRAFDLYLYLVKKAQEGKSRIIKIDNEELGREKGSLAILGEDRYGLVRHKAGSEYVELVEVVSEQYINIPNAYWDYGFDKRLGLHEKYAYLIALAEAGKSARNPYWYRSGEDMSEMYHISRPSISLGLAALEKENIVEVYRHEPREGGGGFSDRPANQYRLNPLRGAGEFERGIEALAGKYGAEVVGQARGLAAELDEPWDLEKIERYVGLVREYGFERVRAVNAEVAGKGRQTGFRDVEQVVLILKRK